MQDEQIIDLYWERNEQAIAESDRAYGALCHSIAMNILSDRMDAEECVNDTWLHSWNAMPPQRPGNLRAFFCRITRNLSLDRYRSRHKTRARGDGFELSLEELAECLPDPDTLREDDPISDLLNGFLGSLKPLFRKLLVGRYWHGYSVKQLADTYGLTANHVSVTLKRTREALRAYLTERGYRI